MSSFTLSYFCADSFDKLMREEMAKQAIVTSNTSAAPLFHPEVFKMPPSPPESINGEEPPVQPTTNRPSQSEFLALFSLCSTKEAAKLNKDLDARCEQQKLSPTLGCPKPIWDHFQLSKKAAALKNTVRGAHLDPAAILPSTRPRERRSCRKDDYVY